MPNATVGVSALSDTVDRFLFVAVPPTSVQVTDDLNVVKNGITSAYAEGASMTLTCAATGGKPHPRVSCVLEVLIAKTFLKILVDHFVYLCLNPEYSAEFKKKKRRLFHAAPKISNQKAT